MARYEILALHCRRITLVCIALLLGIIAIHTLIAPSNSREPSAVIWLIASLPLLLFVRGAWRGAVRSFVWLSFVSLLYFLHAVTAVFVPARTWLDMVNLALVVTLFISAMLAVRYTARAQRDAAS